jgi:hypothetical protein
VFRIRLILAAVLLAGLGCSSKKEINREEQRLWGKDKLEQEFAEKAKESIDAYSLDERPDLKSRVLNMRFEEVIARMGFVEYTGSARFLLKRNGHTIDVPENSVIRQGLHGSFFVRQLDQDGEIAREVIYNNGILYGQNGPKGKMRVMGIIKDAHMRVRDEAWQPLRVFSSYFGPRFGLRKIGAATVGGRSAANYELMLLEGSPLIEVPGMKGAKKPISLKGNLYVDDGTGVPVKANLKGRLEIPPEKPDSGEKPGELDLTLTFDLKPIEGAEIKPKEFIPEIKRREVDLEPLAFLEGETRTSTVIGGQQRPLTPPPPPPAPPPAVEPPKKEAPPATIPSKPAKKKTKKKKKRK